MFKQLRSWFNRPVRTGKAFQVYVKKVVKGVFIVQETTECVDTIDAVTQAEADATARRLYGAQAYAVGCMG